jgi:hypothetical protein
VAFALKLKKKKKKPVGFYLFIFYLKRFITQTVYTGCTRINCKTVSVASLNKYLHYGTSGTE